MVYEIFVPQLVRTGASLCTLCGGKTMNGLNCTTASMAMWLYRASQGRVRTDACHVRDLTDDCVGGTNLTQMEAVAAHYGITGGKKYQPIDFNQVVAWVKTGRYGAILDILYAPLTETAYDRFHDSFFGNHAIFLSGPGKTSTTLRTGDPGAVGYVDIPISLLKTAAGKLDLGGHTVGYGKCYAYVGPADPAVPNTLYHFQIKGRTPIYQAPETKPYRYLQTGSGPCRKRRVNGHLWFQVVKPGSTINGKWLHAGPTVTVTPI